MFGTHRWMVIHPPATSDEKWIGSQRKWKRRLTSSSALDAIFADNPGLKLCRALKNKFYADSGLHRFTWPVGGWRESHRGLRSLWPIHSILRVGCEVLDSKKEINKRTRYVRICELSWQGIKKSKRLFICLIKSDEFANRTRCSGTMQMGNELW